MDRDFRKDATQRSAGKPPSESELFALAILGKPIPRIVRPEVEAKAQREELERLAQCSTRDADELRRLQAAEAEARHDRELLEWAAQFSTRAAKELRALHSKEAEERKAWRREERFVAMLLEGTAETRQSQRPLVGRAESYPSEIVEWNPDQPRQPSGTPEGGRWAPKGGGGGGGGTRDSGGRVTGGAERIAPNPSDPSRWYLPSDAKGEWLGAKGESAFRLKPPINVNGKLVHEIEFTKGVPFLDKFALPGKTATIILTGDHPTDIRHAEEAWRNLNPGTDLPTNATFHHDLLHATEEAVTIDGKKTKVLVGKMQLIPADVNKAVFHQGSASVATKYYQGLGVDVGSVARLAKEEVRLAGKSGTIVSRALGKINPGKIAKGLGPLVGRSIARAIPIVGSGLAILEFADNVEAHGIGGAVARATPLLGDVISASDLGSDLANQIRDEADTAAGEARRQLNAPSRKAWEQADEQTIAVYNELAPRIQVTNLPRSGDGAGLVDPQEIAAALHEYRQEMQNANFKRNVGLKGFDFDTASAHNKQELRQRLERASQNRGPAPRGPMA